VWPARRSAFCDPKRRGRVRWITRPNVLADRRRVGDSELPSSSFLRSLHGCNLHRDKAACVLSTWTTSPRRLSVSLGLLLLDAGFRLLRSFFHEVLRDHSDPGGFRQLPKLSAPPGSSVLVPTATVPNFPS